MSSTHPSRLTPDASSDLTGCCCFSLIPLSQVEGLGPHPHSFLRDGDEKRVVSATVDGSAGKDRLVGTLQSGMKDLLVLKSGGSSFTGFFRDENTTLPGQSIICSNNNLRSDR